MLGSGSIGKEKGDTLDSGSPDSKGLLPLGETSRLEMLLKRTVAIPVVGGALASGINDYFNTRRWERADECLRRIADQVERLDDKIGVLDENYVRTDEFQDLFNEAMDNYIRTGDEIRHEYLVGFIISSMKGPENRLERDFFKRKISELAAVHLELLKLYASPKRAFLAKGLPIDTINGYDLKSLLRAYFPGMNEEIWRAVQQELYTSGLVGSDKGSFGVLTASSGLMLANSMLTDLGKRFVNSCVHFKKDA